MLNWWWVRRIGVLSYSIYIWQLFCTKPEVFGFGTVGGCHFQVGWSPTFVIGLALFWQFGLSPHLRVEVMAFLSRLRKRLRSLPDQAGDPNMKV